MISNRFNAIKNLSLPEEILRDILYKHKALETPSCKAIKCLFKLLNDNTICMIRFGKIKIQNQRDMRRRGACLNLQIVTCPRVYPNIERQIEKKERKQVSRQSRVESTIIKKCTFVPVNNLVYTNNYDKARNGFLNHNLPYMWIDVGKMKQENNREEIRYFRYRFFINS